MDILIQFTMTIVLIVGVYQFYFWTQNHPIRQAIELKESFIDKFFTLKPAWVYIYSGLYYPVIVFTVLSVKDMHHYNYIAMSFMILLLIQMACFLIYPVSVPKKWRELPNDNRFSIKFLKLVQSFDKTTNCFPSMHVSVSTLTALHLLNNETIVGLPDFQFGYWVWGFPILIAISALYTKQHYFIDIVFGFLPGFLAFWFFQQTYIP